MKKIINVSKGKNFFLNKPLYERYQRQYSFVDGNLQYATAIIKNEKGQIYIAYNKKHKIRQFPAGKIDKGEKAGDGLKREMNEELGIDITQIKYLGYCKAILQGMIWQGHHYEVNNFEGEITNKEPEILEEGIRINILNSDNLLGFVIKVGNNIIDDIDSLMGERSNVIRYQNFVLNSDYNNIQQNFKLDLSKIKKDKDYIQYFDTDRQEYGVLEKSLFF